MNICLRDLPTRKKSRLPSRVPTHAYADCEISGQQPTQLYKEFPRVHEVGHSKKNAAHLQIFRKPEKYATSFRVEAPASHYPKGSSFKRQDSTCFKHIQPSNQSIANVCKCQTFNMFQQLTQLCFNMFQMYGSTRTLTVLTRHHVIVEFQANCTCE